MVIAPEAIISFLPITSVETGTSLNKYPLRILVTTTSSICSNVSLSIMDNEVSTLERVTYLLSYAIWLNANSNIL